MRTVCRPCIEAPTRDLVRAGHHIAARRFASITREVGAEPEPDPHVGRRRAVGARIHRATRPSTATARHGPAVGRSATGAAGAAALLGGRRHRAGAAAVTPPIRSYISEVRPAPSPDSRPLPERTIAGFEMTDARSLGVDDGAAGGTADGGSYPAPFVSAAPTSALAPLVARVHLCRESSPPEGVLYERVLPDGTLRLHAHLAHVPRAVVPASSTTPAATPSPTTSGATIEVSGSSDTATVLRIAGDLDGVSVDLRPGASVALLGIPAGELRDQTLSLDSLWGAEAPLVLEQIAAAPHGARRLAAVERALLTRATRPPGRSARWTRHADATAALASALVSRIAATGGRESIRDLAAHIGLTPRRLEQIFYTHVGLAPKAMCRLARFHTSLRIACRPRAPGARPRNWSDIAHACGYADQAHLVREYRAVAGLTPTELRGRLL